MTDSDLSLNVGKTNSIFFYKQRLRDTIPHTLVILNFTNVEINFNQISWRSYR